MGAILADKLKAAVRANFGHAADAFIERLQKVADWGEVKERIEVEVASLVPSDADGQVRRAAKRFALAIVTGEMAVEWGVLPWSAGRVREAVTSVFNDWLAYRGGVGSSDQLSGLKKLDEGLSRDGSAKFGRANDPDLRIHDQKGYRVELFAPNESTPRGYLYYIDPGAFEEYVGHRATKPVLDALEDAGRLLVGEGRNRFRKTPKTLDPSRARRVCVYVGPGAISATKTGYKLTDDDGTLILRTHVEKGPTFVVDVEIDDEQTRH